MAAEYSANALQTVAVNAPVIFTASPFPCNEGLIYHRDESGLFRLAARGCGCRSCRCTVPVASYLVEYHGNISIPEEGGVVGPISLALAIDGEVDPSSIMTVTPAALDEANNVGAAVIVSIPLICGCGQVSVRNVSTQPINVENSNILFSYLGIRNLRR